MVSSGHLLIITPASSSIIAGLLVAAKIQGDLHYKNQELFEVMLDAVQNHSACVVAVDEFVIQKK